MQGFAWLGKIFFEIGLVFGASSSPGIFDAVAKIVVRIAASRAGFPSYLYIQHLDDVCACSPEGSVQVDQFYDSYLDTCEKLNIKLADPGDPDKAFSPRMEGQVLGINYDSTDMTWSLGKDKLNIILNIIEEVMENGEASVRTFKKLSGKLVDIRDLVVGSKFHLAHLLMVATTFNEKEDMENVLEVSEWLLADLQYFSLVLPVYSGRSQLQDPDRRPDWWALESHTDAAGGSRESLGRGVGMILGPDMWTYVPWGRRINEGWRAYDGKLLSHKMSAWELVGPLLALVCGGNMLSGKQLKVFVDNDGSVRMWKKGWCMVCDLCNSILVALHQVSTALACELFICGIMRCSNEKAEAADALSKCDMKRFWRCMPGANVSPEEVPGSLLAWLENPVPDRLLGDRILKEMAGKCKLLNYH